MDRHLPGFAPEYLRIEIHRQADGTLLVEVLAASDRRYLSSADRTSFDQLGELEALDVISATLDSVWTV